MNKNRPTKDKAKYRYYFAEWRKHRGLTQDKLAELTGLTPSSISQLENGKQGFTQSTIEALAEALGCKPGDLLQNHPTEKNGKDMLSSQLQMLTDTKLEQAKSYISFLIEQEKG